MKRLLLLLAVAVFPLIAIAADTATTPLPPTMNGAAPPASATVSCFDYYKFGSVTADLTLPTGSVVSGTSATFNGTVKNTNPYPIVDGTLYVKIFRERGSGKDVNGPDVVDQFVVRDGINLPGKGELPFAFSWRVPAYAKGGNYRAATYFTTSKKFNLLGLSFTDDVVGNALPFTVSSEQPNLVQFDKDNVTINAAPFRFAAFPPTISATATAIISVPIPST
jgi:hypothetical protein